MALVEMIDSLINDIGTGLNEATIRSRLLSLREQAEAQDARLKDLEAEVIALESQAQTQKVTPDTDGPSDTEVTFLRFLFTEGECSLREIAAKLGIEYGVAEYHKDKLVDSEMIRWSGDTTEDFGEGDPTYVLTSKGRAYVVEHGTPK